MRTSFEKSDTDPFQTQLAQLTDHLREQYPDSFEATLDQQSELSRNLENRESQLNDSELIAALEEYGIDTGKIEQIGEGLYSLDVRNHFTTERLPGGYGYKGGAARALLLRTLDIDPSYTPRDIDIIRLMDEEPYPGADQNIAEQYMPDDNKHGYGVEVVASDRHYLDSRDLTINELLATDERVIATRACILDTVRQIIRPASQEREKGSLQSGMLAKILRFYSEAILRYDEAAVSDVENWEYEEYFISPFWLSLNLDKAFQQGYELARIFTEELKKRKQIPQTIQTPEEAASYLAELLRGDSFYYRHAPSAQIESEYERLGDEYEHLPHFSGHGRAAA